MSQRHPRRVVIDHYGFADNRLLLQMSYKCNLELVLICILASPIIITNGLRKLISVLTEKGY
jgi:hypothetical protein